MDLEGLMPPCNMTIFVTLETVWASWWELASIVARALAAFLMPAAVCSGLKLRSTTPSFLLTSSMRALMGAPAFSVPSTCVHHKSS